MFIVGGGRRDILCFFSSREASVHLMGSTGDTVRRFSSWLWFLGSRNYFARRVFTVRLWMSHCLPQPARVGAQGDMRA